jgi:hypothetical protein
VVLVPTVSSLLVDIATGNGRATMRRQCAVTARFTPRHAPVGIGRSD